MNYLGIDIGGTKTSVCVGDEKGQLRASERIPTEGTRPADAFFERLFPLCRRVAKKAGLELEQIDGVGVGAPGPICVSKGIVFAAPNMPAWKDVQLVQRLAEGLRRPVAMNNDANACALAEFLFGTHRGTKNLVYLTHSTGMGGGIILNGRLVQGVTDTGGEVGHQVIDPAGPPCGCGMRGCFEAYCGGRNAANRLRERIRTEGICTSILEKAGGNPDAIDFKTFVEAAREGDAFALEEWDRYMERLAQGIGNLIMVLNPEVIILGTIAIHTGDFLMTPLRERLKRYVWKWPLEACRLDVSSLGSRIGDLAAIAVAIMPAA